MSEFSRIVDLRELSEQETIRDVAANAAERAALAARFGLSSIEELRASLRLRRGEGGDVRLAGAYRASVGQTCVATLDPLPGEIEGGIDLRCVPAEASAAREVVVDPAEDVEVLSGDSIDIGEIVAQELAVSLDPYPRRPDADPLEEGAGGRDSGAEAAAHPFAALARLGRIRRG